MRKTTSLGVLLIASLLAIAATPQIKTFFTQEQLEKGKANGVSIDALGQLKLAPAVMEAFRATVPYFWSLAADEQGTIYAGGGNPAIVIRLNPKLQADTVFASQDVAIFAVAVVKDELYIATSPDGQVYRRGKDGKAKPFFKPQAKYIWAIEPGKDGSVFVATGEPARIFLLKPTGEEEVFFESEENHIRSLCWDAQQGTLYAGSSGNGYLYSLEPNGQVRVLYDAPLDEIHGIAAHGNGSVYIAAAGAGMIRPGIPAAPAVASPESTEQSEGDEAVIVISDGEESEPQIAPNPEAGGRSQVGAVYRVNDNGTAKTVWSSATDRVHSLLMASDPSAANGAHLLIGTGDKGKVYRLELDGTRTLLFESDAGQITSIARLPGGQTAIASANPGAVQLIHETDRDRGEYHSEVIDASVASHWGAISWQSSGGGSAEFLTRSGNTGKPDKTWSAWVPVQASGSGGVIASPMARFLQWQVKLAGNKGQKPTVKRIQIAYLQRNVPPEVTRISIYNPGEAFPEAGQNSANHSLMQNDQDGEEAGQQTSLPGRKSRRKGAQSLGWQARDDNSDQLEYKVEIQAVGDQGWRELVKEYRGQVYTFDSQALPDGEYLAKITASDRLSNPPEMAQASDKSSEIFVIDNSPPEIADLAVANKSGALAATFGGRDRFSPIHEAWFALDAGEWKLAYPVDQVADQMAEQYEIRLPEGSSGKVLAVKVVDRNGNAGFAKTKVR